MTKLGPNPEELAFCSSSVLQSGVQPFGPGGGGGAIPGNSWLKRSGSVIRDPRSEIIRNFYASKMPMNPCPDGILVASLFNTDVFRTSSRVPSWITPK